MRENWKQILDIKTGNGIIVHVEEESDVLCGMRTNKDDIKQMKTT